MQTLQELGEQLLDICGQQAHQRLRHRVRAARNCSTSSAATTALVAEHGRCARALANSPAMKPSACSLPSDDQQARQDLLAFQLRS